MADELTTSLEARFECDYSCIGLRNSGLDLSNTQSLSSIKMQLNVTPTFIANASY